MKVSTRRIDRLTIDLEPGDSRYYVPNPWSQSFYVEPTQVVAEYAIQAAARNDVPSYEIEAMTKDGLDDLSFPGVRGMIRQAYGELYDVTGADTVMWCLAHRRKVSWIPAPGWWIHDDSLPHTGRPSDPRGCSSMWNAPAPITITRKKPS